MVDMRRVLPSALNPLSVMPVVFLLAIVFWVGYEDVGVFGVALIGLIALGIELYVLRQAHSGVGKSRAADLPLSLEGRVRRSDAHRRSAIFDQTTNLYHRWYLDLRLEEEAERCKRYNYSIAVLVLRAGLIDLSAFSVDDWRGLAVETARLTATAVRNVDLSAALSPMEYAICLIYCDRAGAERALSRLVSVLSDHECQAGISVYPDDGCEPAALIELAKGRLHPVEAAAA